MQEARLIFRGGCYLENMASENDKRIPNLTLAQVANTLLARDYKGLSNYSSNAVLEIYEVKDVCVRT